MHFIAYVSFQKVCFYFMNVARCPPLRISLHKCLFGRILSPVPILKSAFWTIPPVSPNQPSPNQDAPPVDVLALRHEARLSGQQLKVIRKALPQTNSIHLHEKHDALRLNIKELPLLGYYSSIFHTQNSS